MEKIPFNAFADSGKFVTSTSTIDTVRVQITVETPFKTYVSDIEHWERDALKRLKENCNKDDVSLKFPMKGKMVFFNKGILNRSVISLKIF